MHAEQQRLREHDVLVLQHPLYVFLPSAFKEWIDRVLSKGFAFGKQSELKGKLWRSVITTSGNHTAYDQRGYNRYPLNEILQPFELSAALCQMHLIEPLELYWSRNISDQERAQHAERYRQWLQEIAHWQESCMTPLTSDFLSSSVIFLSAAVIAVNCVACGTRLCAWLFAGGDCDWSMGTGLDPRWASHYAFC